MTTYEHVVEIGAGDSASSEGYPLSTHARKVTLFEPNRLLWADLGRAAAGLDHVTVRSEAVSDIGGQYPLVHLGYASYLVGQPSFYPTSIEPEGDTFLAPLKRAVEVVTINQAVPRDVDRLILTIGGGEARLLRAMTARPQIIVTRHYCHNAAQWTHTNEVFAWMEANRYGGRKVGGNQHGTHLAVRWELDSGAQRG
jgi:hypothetical protein